MQRNERFSYRTDIIEPPDFGFHILEIYSEICIGVNIIQDGQPVQISWSDLISWSTIANRVISHFECLIILKMHNAWCIAKEIELDSIRARMRSEASNKNGR